MTSIQGIILSSLMIFTSVCRVYKMYGTYFVYYTKQQIIVYAYIM